VFTLSSAFFDFATKRDTLRFQARSQNYQKRLLASSRLSVCPSILKEKFSSHWTYLYEVLSLSTFSKICREYSSFIKILQA